MSSYKNSLVFSLLLISFTACSDNSINLKVEEPTNYKTVKTKYYPYDTSYIMFALEYENQGQYSKAKAIYKKLFINTNNYEYLEKFVSLAFHQKDYKGVSDALNPSVLEQMKGIRQEESILRVYSFSLMRMNKIEESIYFAKRVLKISPSEVNYELLGSIYLEAKKYNNAYREFENSYTLNNSGRTLLTLTNVEYYYLNKKQSAKRKIEKYIEANGYHYGLSLQLLTFYEKDKENEKVLNLLTKLYDKYKTEKKHVLNIKVRDLLLRYLVQKDINKAIQFVKQNNESDNILLSLYKSANKLDEASLLLKKMFSETNDYNYLGEIAILEFEMNENKQSVLNSVIVKFEKTLENVSNHVFENYLAYILIDYDIDVNKGIKLVNKALKEEPNNYAYIDTLAWGEYKLKNCSNAYNLMKKVVDEVGLEDSEVKLHWERIKECSK